MSGNKNYDKDIRYTLQVSRIVLSLIGVWPSTSPPTGIKNVALTILRIACYSLHSFVLIPGFLKMFLKETNPRRRLKMVGPMCNGLMAFLKYTILCCRGNQLRGCVKHVEDDWRKVLLADDRNIMLNNAQIGRSLAILCVAFVYGSGFSYRIFVPLSKGTVVTAENVTIRPLGFSGYYIFFDPQVTPAYEIVFAMQFMAGFVTYSSTSGVCSLAALFVMHGCGQLKILISKLQDLAATKDSETSMAEARLAIMVQHHMRVKSFLKEVEDVLQHMCLVEVIGCTLILCLLGYYIIMEWEDNDSIAMVTYTMLLATFTFNLFILCFIGELLTDQGIKVAITSCTLNWYNLPDKIARCLVLVISMSSCPITLTAGKFIDLSLNSFGAVVRTSVAYLNMLRATSF